MSRGDGLGWLWALQVGELEEKVRARADEDELVRLREQAAGKLRDGGNLTRDEVAAHLSVSAKTVQRMEGSGRLARCPDLGTLVRYAARDVLRLASAPGKER